ncbi:hypothetical protein [Halalkalicoccus salilacus]|uniref:hypothetical protein n=1 Tax=Halalkalicoccus sp. GCM10025704 TaxID=3252662 RepID=UPI00361849B0
MYLSTVSSAVRLVVTHPSEVLLLASPARWSRRISQHRPEPRTGSDGHSSLRSTVIANRSSSRLNSIPSSRIPSWIQ